MISITVNVIIYCYYPAAPRDPHPWEFHSTDYYGLYSYSYWGGRNITMRSFILHTLFQTSPSPPPFIQSGPEWSLSWHWAWFDYQSKPITSILLCKLPITILHLCKPRELAVTISFILGHSVLEQYWVFSVTNQLDTTCRFNVIKPNI